jgi:hypothetical protein
MKNVLFFLFVSLFFACQNTVKETQQNPFNYQIIKVDANGYTPVTTKYTRVKKGYEKAFLEAALNIEMTKEDMEPQPQSRYDSHYCNNFPCNPSEAVNPPLNFELMEGEVYVEVLDILNYRPVLLKNVEQFLE